MLSLISSFVQHCYMYMYNTPNLWPYTHAHTHTHARAHTHTHRTFPIPLPPNYVPDGPTSFPRHGLTISSPLPLPRGISTGFCSTVGEAIPRTLGESGTADLVMEPVRSDGYGVSFLYSFMPNRRQLCVEIEYKPYTII